VAVLGHLNAATDWFTENLSESKDAAREDANGDKQLVRGAKHSTQVVRRYLSQVQRCQLRCHAYNDVNQLAVSFLFFITLHTQLTFQRQNGMKLQCLR